ncbi:MAG: hypothetical protein AAGI51_10945 [Pseudomonadota bacterium]
MVGMRWRAATLLRRLTAAMGAALAPGAAGAFMLVVSSDDPAVVPQTVLDPPWPIEIATGRRVDTIDADGVLMDWYGAHAGPLETYARGDELHRARRLAWAAERRRRREVIGALRADGAFLTEFQGVAYAAIEPSVVLGAASVWCEALPDALRGDAAVAALGLPRMERDALPGVADDWRRRLEMPALVPDGDGAMDPFDRRDALFALLMLMDRSRPGGRRLAALDGLGGRQRLAVVCAALAR